MWLATLLILGACGTACPLPVDVEHQASVHEIIEARVEYRVSIEAVSKKTGKRVHTAEGPLQWGQKAHLGGQEHRGNPWDRPDWEVNSKLITPDKIWTST